MPEQHRGVATGAIYVMFGIGSTIGVSLGTVLLTAAFRYYSGDATVIPTPANRAVFVKSMNFSFFMGGMMALVAMAWHARPCGGRRRAGDAPLVYLLAGEKELAVCFRMLVQMFRLRDIHGNHFDVGEFLLDGVGDPFACRDFEEFGG